jgi:tetratricopeptide (TPR) repeat protein
LGVSIGEQSAASVNAFVRRIGVGLSYPIAVDAKAGQSKGRMAETWMEAAGMGAPRFIPTSFIVSGTGRILWIGSTFDLRIVIERVLASDWDASAFARIFKSQQARMNQEYVLRHDPVLEQLGSIRKSMASGEFRLAVKQIDSIAMLKSPKVKQAAALMLPVKFVALRQLHDMKTYYAESRKAATEWASDPHILNALAWDIVDPASRLEYKDYDLAIQDAEKAVQLTDRKNANLLDTLAWAHWEKGHRTAAVAFEQEALSLAQGPDKQEMSKTLARFSMRAKP